MNQSVHVAVCTAKVIKDSIGRDAPRLVTFELEYPRIIHAELMTHRVFSRNASSSRAIPVERVLQRVLQEPVLPAEWRMNQPGMQGYEVADADTALKARAIWLEAATAAVEYSKQLAELGLHKQHVNRLTEPFQLIKVLVTSSQWKNWYGLRTHRSADPTIQQLATVMEEAMNVSEPVLLEEGQWHLPYIVKEDEYRALDYLTNHGAGSYLELMEILRRMSAARCARVSYNNFSGDVPEVAADLALYEKLVVSQPVHASPTEHQASPDIYLSKPRKTWRHPEMHGNLRGWLQYRKFIPNENLECVE